MHAHIARTALFALALLSPAAPSLAQGPEAAPKGFVDLLPNANLDGWWGAKTENPAKYLALSPEKLAAKRAKSRDDILAHWSVANGVLSNDGKGLFLTTEKNYADFELRIDYKTVAKADSGIYLRGIPQVQIWDTTKAGGKWKIGADRGSGGLWNNSAGAPGKDPIVLADKEFGVWNRFRIVMVGERVTVFLNGKLVVDHARMENYFNRKGNLPKEGPLQLQTHGGAIHWRNIFIREIDAEEANRILAKGGGAGGYEGFAPVFNGRNLKGFKGPVKNYQVTEDGTLMCKKGKGGTIYTEEEYEDFAVQVEFNLPPGGNNGLALRYPGRGDTAYEGMCELQVLDDGHPKYAKIKPQQCHGSVYGQVAARRGFLRPAGTWNHQLVTVVGSRIAVELNGFLILDADILEDADYMYPKDRFKGRKRKKGHFGFAGHSDPVAYRNVWIRRL